MADKSLRELRERLIEDVSITLHDTVWDLIPCPPGKFVQRSQESVCLKIAADYHEQLFCAVQEKLFYNRGPALVPGLGQILLAGKQPPEFLAAIEFSITTKTDQLPLADDGTVRLELQKLLMANYQKIEDILKQEPDDAAKELAQWLLALHEDAIRQLIAVRPVFIASLGKFKIDCGKIIFDPSDNLLLMLDASKRKPAE